MTLLDRTPLFARLADLGLSDAVPALQALCAERLRADAHGTLPQWTAAWHQLPDVPDAAFDASGETVTVTGRLPEAAQRALSETLMAFHPWRKGPFELFGVHIDTEWQSQLKWQRLVGEVEFRDRRVLDIGCGNGWYGWKMLDAGADLVVGCDPFLLYVLQFEVIRRYAPSPERLFVIPLGDTDLPAGLTRFDTAVSMGVLYHRTSPIDHLQTLWNALRPGGELVLETLIVESADATAFVPPGRYAKMRNVWFLPSLAMLDRWLHRTGFREIRVLDVTATTSVEQRRTDWMTFESLADFLDPADSRRTIEGHPAPVRALVTARRS